jgi:phosphoribosylformylglycinamidine synthase
LDTKDPGLSFQLTFDPSADPLTDLALVGSPAQRPRVAILREQGVNGHVEMAVAFDRAGFEAIDVHMSDILSGRVQLSGFTGIAACGGFSYGDVLGAGTGWAKHILLNPTARPQFAELFHRPNTFVLGVCNGCQMVSQLKDLSFSEDGNDTLGISHWPAFTRNQSEQFEARYCMVEVCPSPASNIWFTDMVGSKFPIAVAHGEGRAEFASAAQLQSCQSQVTLRYVDNYGQPTEVYPLNPNGSPAGITSVCSRDGRILIMMPHPERVIRTASMSWHPADLAQRTAADGNGPWLRMFRNVRRWVG